MPEEEAERLFEHCFDAWFQEALRSPPEGVRRVLRRRARGRDRLGPREALARGRLEARGHRDFTAPVAARPVRSRRGRRRRGGRALRARRGRRPGRRGRRRLPRQGARQRLAASPKSWPGASSYAPATTTASRPSSPRSRARGSGPGASGAAPRRAALARRGRGAARRRARPARRRPRGVRTPTSPPASTPSSAPWSSRTSSGRRAPASSTSSTCSSAPATSSRATAARGRTPAPLRPRLRRRVPGHRPAPGRDPPPARGRGSGGDRVDAGGPRARQALPRRRSQAVHLPLPPRRRGALRGHQAAARRGRRLAALPDDELPQRARDPGRGQRGVRARHGAATRPARRRATSRSSSTAGDPRPARARRAARPAAVRPLGQGHRHRDRASRCPTRSAPSSTGSSTRAAGRSPSGTPPSPSASRRATSACSSSASRASATTSPARYVRALEARRVPHVLVGGRSFYEREEVQAVSNALAAIEWPDDELSRLRDAARPVLRALRRRAPRLPRRRGRRALPEPLRVLLPRPAAPPPRARGGASRRRRQRRRGDRRARVLRELHLGRNRRPIADTLAAAPRGDARARRASPSGRPASRRSPTCSACSTSRAASRRRARPRFRAFVERLDADAESGRRAKRRSSRRAPRACGS